VRGALTSLAYVVLLGAGLVAVTMVGDRHVLDAPLIVALLATIGVCAYLTSHALRTSALAFVDMGLALALLALAVGGPRAALIVLVLPDAIWFARRRKASLVYGLLANLTSYVASVLAGAGVLALDPAHTAAGGAPALVLAGVAMAAANYTFARLLFATLRDGERPLALIRREFVPMLPTELAMIAAATASFLLLPSLGVVALLIFAAFVSVPQVAAAMLLRAPSAAAVSIDVAAAVYRAALVDELRLSRLDRRCIELIDALVEGRPPTSTVEEPLAAMQDALLVRVCTMRPPSQPAFTASPRAQVVLVARRWAQLTAKFTPALSHPEALRELAAGPLARDAPAALTAAARIVQRERPLTEHIAAVPRLHRAPVPRRARQQLLAQLLVRITT
jgi:hypothetical protein